MALTTSTKPFARRHKPRVLCPQPQGSSPEARRHCPRDMSSKAQVAGAMPMGPNHYVTPDGPKRAASDHELRDEGHRPRERRPKPSALALCPRPQARPFARDLGSRTLGPRASSPGLNPPSPRRQGPRPVAPPTRTLDPTLNAMGLKTRQPWARSPRPEAICMGPRIRAPRRGPLPSTDGCHDSSWGTPRRLSCPETGWPTTWLWR